MSGSERLHVSSSEFYCSRDFMQRVPGRTTAGSVVGYPVGPSQYALGAFCRKIANQIGCTRTLRDQTRYQLWQRSGHRYGVDPHAARNDLLTGLLVEGGRHAPGFALAILWR